MPSNEKVRSGRFFPVDIFSHLAFPLTLRILLVYMSWGDDRNGGWCSLSGSSVCRLLGLLDESGRPDWKTLRDRRRSLLRRGYLEERTVKIGSREVVQFRVPHVAIPPGVLAALCDLGGGKYVQPGQPKDRGTTDPSRVPNIYALSGIEGSHVSFDNIFRDERFAPLLDFSREETRTFWVYQFPRAVEKNLHLLKVTDPRERLQVALVALCKELNCYLDKKVPIKKSVEALMTAVISHLGNRVDGDKDLAGTQNVVRTKLFPVLDKLGVPTLRDMAETASRAPSLKERDGDPVEPQERQPVPRRSAAEEEEQEVEDDWQEREIEEAQERQIREAQEPNEPEEYDDGTTELERAREARRARCSKPARAARSPTATPPEDPNDYLDSVAAVAPEQRKVPVAKKPQAVPPLPAQKPVPPAQAEDSYPWPPPDWAKESTATQVQPTPPSTPPGTTVAPATIPVEATSEPQTLPEDPPPDAVAWMEREEREELERDRQAAEEAARLLAEQTARGDWN